MSLYDLLNQTRSAPMRLIYSSVLLRPQTAAVWWVSNKGLATHEGNNL